MYKRSARYYTLSSLSKHLGPNRRHSLAWLSLPNSELVLCGVGFQLPSLFQNVTQD
jgi:hypothetical protein